MVASRSAWQRHRGSPDVHSFHAGAPARLEYNAPVQFPWCAMRPRLQVDVERAAVTVPEDDDGADVRPHVSRAVRAMLVVVGTLCVVLGVIGILLPVLPTTPFLLLAAACYARASERFYRWLLGNPTFGPTIREWRRHRSIAYRTKVVAIAMMSITIAFSIALLSRYPLVQVLLALMGVIVGVWLYRVPSRDHR